MQDEDGWIECWQCGGEGYSHHDCGDDTCCCLCPEDNIVCDICGGEGGWFDFEELTLNSEKE